jgi:hypothetical protein
MDVVLSTQEPVSQGQPEVSRRECLTHAAAAAMGYTLAAGPVRAAAIKTGTEGLSCSMAAVKVAGGEMPAISRGRGEPQNRR